MATSQLPPVSTISVLVQPGRVSRWVELPDMIIRHVAPSREAVLEGEGGAWHFQGRIVNISPQRLLRVQWDVSYFDGGGVFLGLDRVDPYEDDEIEAGDFLAVDMALTMPPEAERVLFNVRAKRSGLISRLFFGR